ncbi:MAG: phosphoribosyl-AMP cyclohydrolase, partial [Pseudomonadota bacterium]
IQLIVEAGGDGKACHTGRKSCFYRRVTAGADGAILSFIEN